MKISCPTCGQHIAISGEAYESIRDLPSFDCPACSAEVPVPSEFSDAGDSSGGSAASGGRRYEKRSRIAGGGMGEVFGAWQVGMGREVAMKVIRGGTTSERRRRFLIEAKITGRLEHPNIVPIHEIGENEDGEPFYTMKLVNGENLASILRSLAEDNGGASVRYPLAQLLTVFLKVCDAVSFAHSRGVIHRDLKPDNIMVGDHGEVLVMDWGVAKIIGDAAESEEGEPRGDGTLEGSLVGTPAYMAPEQARGEVNTLDERADIFALGRILFEILHLRPAISSGNVLDLVEKAAAGSVDPDRSRRGPHLPGGKIPEALAAVCAKAMAVDRGDRYAGVVELQRELTAYQNGFATTAQRAGFLTQAALFMKRHKAVVTAAAVSLLVLLVMAAVFVVRVVKERDRAVTAEKEERAAHQELEQAVGSLGEVKTALLRSETELKRRNTELDAEIEQKLQAVATAEKRLKNLQAAADVAAKLSSQVPAIQGGVTALHDELANALVSLSAARARQTELEQALASAKRASEVAPRSYRARVNYGTRLLLSGEYGLAAWEYRAALNSGEDDLTDAENLLALAERSGEESEGQGGISEETFRAIEEVLRRLGRMEENAAAIRELARSGVEFVDPEAAEEARTKEMRKLEIKQEVMGRLAGLRMLDGWKDDRVTVRDDGTLEVNLSSLPVLRAPDFSGLDVTKLNLFRCSLDDISALRGMKIKWLDLGANHELRDLSALQSMPLEWLSLWDNNKLGDFSVVEGLATLRDLSLPSNCSGFDSSRLRSLKTVAHPRIFPADKPRGPADRFIKLSRLSDVAWTRWRRDLEKLGGKDMRRDRVTVYLEQSQRLEKGFELDLRGTEIADLEPLKRMPVRRLHIDTNLPRPLDLGPLRAIRTLRALNLEDAHVSRLEPAFPLAGLQQLVVGRMTRDIPLVGNHPTLQRIGYEYDWHKDQAKMTKDEFFKKREKRPEFPREGLVFEETFDDHQSDLGDWSAVDEDGRDLGAGWAPDVLFAPRRGGGFLRYHEPGGDALTGYFKADSKLVAALGRSAGGLLEYEIRQRHDGDNEAIKQLEFGSKAGRIVRADMPVPELCWRRMVVPLYQDGAWRKNRADGRLAKDAEIAAVLRSLDTVLIQAEYSSRGNELSGLDEIRVWNRKGGAGRKAMLDKEQEDRMRHREWARGAKVVSGNTRPYLFNSLGKGYEVFDEGAFVDELDGRKQVLVVHAKSRTAPATVTIPFPEKAAARFRMEARSCPNVGPGVMVKCRQKGRNVLLEKQVDEAWENLSFELPEDAAAGAELLIEVWPVNWSFEFCHFSIVGFDPRD